jgi:hypothetical protein
LLISANYEVCTNEKGEYVIRLKVPTLYELSDYSDDNNMLQDDEEMEDFVEDSGTSVNSTFNELEESWE